MSRPFFRTRPAGTVLAALLAASGWSAPAMAVMVRSIPADAEPVLAPAVPLPPLVQPIVPIEPGPPSPYPDPSDRIGSWTAVDGHVDRLPPDAPSRTAVDPSGSRRRSTPPRR